MREEGRGEDRAEERTSRCMDTGRGRCYQELSRGGSGVEAQRGAGKRAEAGRAKAHGGSWHMQVEGRGRQERGWKERERRKMNDRYRRLRERKG